MAKPTNRVPGGNSLKQARIATGEESEVMDLGPGAEPEASRVQPTMKSFERTYSKVKRIVSDVFKLLPANVVKQVGAESNIDVDPDSFREFEHCHIFRTFDSDGKRHTRCCSTGGHYHDVEWDYDNDGKPFIKSVSGPMTTTTKMVRGKRTQVSIPVNKYDDHTHDFEYLLSHEVQARTSNIEASKVIAADSIKGAAPAGAHEK